MIFLQFFCIFRIPGTGNAIGWLFFWGAFFGFFFFLKKILKTLADVVFLCYTYR